MTPEEKKIKFNTICQMSAQIGLEFLKQGKSSDESIEKAFEYSEKFYNKVESINPELEDANRQD